MNFKFKVSQTVYHKLWKRNGQVSRRLYIEDITFLGYNAYDVAFNTDDNSAFKAIDEVCEKWLTEERHDVE